MTLARLECNPLFLRSFCEAIKKWSKNKPKYLNI